MAQGPRSKERRAEENQRYRERLARCGIVTTTVMVPAGKLVELKAITLAWRNEAKLLCDPDQFSANQILRIHGVCRALGVRLPAEAFESQAAAAAWLLARQPALGASLPDDQPGIRPEDHHPRARPRIPRVRAGG